MKEIKDESFVVIENQVAMTEEAVADLLNIDVEKLRAVSDYIGITNVKGKIYEREGKYYYTSQEIIFKVRDTNDKKSADLSSGGLVIAFEKAEDRLLPKEILIEKHKERKKRNIIFGVVILVVILGLCFIGVSHRDSSPPVKTQTVVAPKKEVRSLGFSPVEFAQKFNQQSKTMAPQFQFAVPAPDILESGTFGYIFNNGYEMLGIIDKESNKVIELRLTGLPFTPEQAGNLMMLYAITMATVNPELQPEQRGQILKQLGLDVSKNTDFTTLNGKTKVGNYSYTAKFDKDKGFIFVITARY